MKGKFFSSIQPISKFILAQPTFAVALPQCIKPSLGVLIWDQIDLGNALGSATVPSCWVDRALKRI